MKTKPTQIIVHRIELQQFERSILENLQTAYIGTKIVDPFVEILKDVSALASLLSIYLVYRYGEDVLDHLKDTYESTQELLADGFKIAKNNKEIARSAVAGIPIPFAGNLGQIYDVFDLIF